jgi:maleylpyruvate isomerase
MLGPMTVSGTARTLADNLRWMTQTTVLFRSEASLSPSRLAEDSLLPGWTRAHVVAHVAANASALLNLCHWAQTGQPSPMYASPSARTDGIEEGSRLSAGELSAWLDRATGQLEETMAKMTASQWQNPVVTNAGRTVPATEIPWMRTRETAVHSVDLGTGVTFGELPAALLTALCDDVVARRGPGTGLTLAATDAPGTWHLAAEGPAVSVSGPLAEVTAYLTGRPHQLEQAPVLAPWL